MTPVPSMETLGPSGLIAALVVGAGGASATAYVFVRALQFDLSRKSLWLLLAAVLAGLSVWGGHLVAVVDLAERANRRIDAGQALTALGLAMLGAAAALLLTQTELPRTARRALGGAALGLVSAATARLMVDAMAPAEGIRFDDGVFALGAAVGAAGLAAATCLFPDPSDRRGPVRWAALMTLGWVALLLGQAAALAVAPHAAAWPADDAVSPRLGYLILALIGGPLILLGLVARLTDRAVRREAMLRDRHAALHDHLTDLPNRRALGDALARALDGEGPVGVVALDLDRFKPLNDVHGHETGDRVLRTIARRFVDALQPGEMIARTGGDEFVGLKTDVAGRDEMEDFARRLRDAALRPIRHESFSVAVGASLGACVHPTDHHDGSTLLACADLALYRAKEESGDAISFYEPGMHEAVRRRSALALQLQDALAQDQFELLYQPQAALRSGEIIGYEALLRWRHPERGLLSPGAFLTVAERSGLTWRLGERVLQQACIEAARWPAHLRIAVNVSPQQINQAGFVELVLDALLASALPAERLELEVTEASMVLDEARTLEVMHALRRTGVRIVMDDYGVGFASLSMLKRFPFDKIKIDREFVQDVATSPQAAAIVRSALLLGEAGGTPVLAEGIETPEQRDWLVAEGCLEGQGYLLGRPAPPIGAASAAASLRAV